MRRPSAALVVAFLALVVSLGGVSFAAIPARDGDVHACYSKKTGALELVDTQKDRFSCEKNWNGLTIDTTPTTLLPPGIRVNAPTGNQSSVEATASGPVLTSPNGKFTLSVTNGGIVLTGPNALVKVGETSVDVTGGATVNVNGGTDVNVLAGRKMTLGSADDLLLSAEDEARAKAKRVVDEALVSYDLIASGAIDMRSPGTFDLRGAVVRANGNSIGGP